jgi:hypothetical protein
MALVIVETTCPECDEAFEIEIPPDALESFEVECTECGQDFNATYDPATGKVTFESLDEEEPDALALVEDEDDEDDEDDEE